jgi:hypothetical protein
MFLPALGEAQTVSGSIAGMVQDTTGAVLPGVTVEAASPALIEKVRTVVTDDQGQYKVVDLRPGLYTVTFSLTGFSTFIRQGIELTTGFTATVNAELKVGTVEETVTVSGESPIVDIQNVRQQNVFSNEVLDALPASKGVLSSWAALIPGAVLSAATAQNVGGNQAELAAFGIHGIAGEQKQMVDGMRYSHISGTGGGRGFHINTALVEEVIVETGGISADTETGGVQFNLVPKEGGNTIKGYFSTSYPPRSLEANNLTDTLRVRGLRTFAPLKRIYDVGGSLGGPIKKDKLWFLTAHRAWGALRYLPGSYYNKTPHTLFYTPDFSRPAYIDNHSYDSSIRLTWKASQKDRVNVGYSFQNNCNCFFQLTGDVAPEATKEHRYHPNYLIQTTWSHPATNRLLFEAGAMLYKNTIAAKPQAGVTKNDIAVLDLSTNYRFGAVAGALAGSGGAYGNIGLSNSNGRTSMSYITGSHAFKTGFFYQYGFSDNNKEINHDVSYTFLRPLVPQSVTFFTTPLIEKERFLDLAIYAQDQWTIKRLTLNLGVRFDYFNGWVPEQHMPAVQFVPARDFARTSNVPNWKDVSPRLGAAYDLFGNGKTALKVFLGRYVAAEALTFAVANNPVLTSVNSATRTWNDANGDLIPQEHELGPLSDALFGQVKITTRYAEDVLLGSGNRGYNWQGSASIQHELRPGVALTVGYFRSWLGNFRVTDNLAVTPAEYDPFCITAPVDARLPGGGGNQICGLYDVTPTKFGRIDNLVTQASHYGKQTQVYNGVDVTISARFGRSGLLSGGLNTGRTVTDNCFVVDSPQLRFCKNTLPFAGQTQVKFSGVYPLPWDLQPSMTFQDIPGIPIAASYVATNAQIAPSLGRDLAAGARGTALVELIEPNTLREGRIRQLDVRMTRLFRLGRVRLSGMFDVYNVFNASPILAMNTRYGSAWLNAQEIMSGRLYKFGTQLDF